METVLIVPAAENGKSNIATLLRPFPFSNTLYASDRKDPSNHILPPKTASYSFYFWPKAFVSALPLPKWKEPGFLLLQKPFIRRDFSHTIKLGNAFQKRISFMLEGNKHLCKQFSEARSIRHAKCTFLQLYSITEDETRHYFENRRMKLHQNKYSTAAVFLKNLENRRTEAIAKANLVDFSY